MTVTASLYILSRRLRRPIPSWPYRLHGAPAPALLTTHPPSTRNPALIYASAERAKPNVLHAGVGRIGKRAALLFDSTELDGGRGPSSSVAVARSLPLLACMNQQPYTDRVRCLHGAQEAPATHRSTRAYDTRLSSSRESRRAPRGVQRRRRRRRRCPPLHGVVGL